MADTESIAALSEALVSELIEAGRSVSVAESCTGGWIAKALTDISGSSQCFAYGVVSYSNGAKESMLVAVSGIAGPDGGTEEKPVGTLWLGWAVRNNKKPVIETEKHLLKGDRDMIRTRSVILAMQGVRERLRKNG
jgi:nicotinamide-nucleotide amidase